jgi:DNA-3-methyladenine glycosylase
MTGLPRAPAPLSRAQLPADATALASYLIGKSVMRRCGAQTLIGRIVETEAYLADDPASHSFIGQTARNRSMYLKRGSAYVYRVYGMWLCLNVAAGPEGEGAAVLLRALEPVAGCEFIQARRPGVRERDLARGPGRLCQAFAIEPSHDGLDLCHGDGPLWLAGPIRRRGEVGVSTRIGIVKAADRALRFYERGNAYVSGPVSLRT